MLTSGLITFALEAVGLAVAVLVVSRLPGTRRILERRSAVAAVLVVVVIATAFANMEATGSELVHAGRAGVPPRLGTDTCLVEDGVGSSVGFVEWLRRRMPSNAIYAYQLPSEPDAWCLTLTLLPRLPVFGSARPGWLVVYGAPSPSVKALIARHDPIVSVYAPGYALVRLNG